MLPVYIDSIMKKVYQNNYIYKEIAIMVQLLLSICVMQYMCEGYYYWFLGQGPELQCGWCHLIAQPRKWKKIMLFIHFFCKEKSTFYVFFPLCRGQRSDSWLCELTPKQSRTYIFTSWSWQPLEITNYSDLNTWDRSPEQATLNRPDHKASIWRGRKRTA